MNAIAFCLDLILASLLLAALYVGFRLDRKLKALKDSHAGFAGAVAELDAAIVKAQDGLATLKSTANQAQTDIADRVQDAKGMSARLDQQAATAKAAAEKLERLLERYPSTVSHAPPAEGRDPNLLALRDRISAARAPGQPLAREALSRSAPPQDRSRDLRFRGDARPSNRADEDELFDLVEPALRAARRGGR